MKHPQTLAERLYEEFPNKKLKVIKEEACCIFTLMWCLGIEPDDTEAILTVSKMINRGIIGEDCTVYWLQAIEYLSGRQATVDFVDITDIKKIKNRTPVRYVYHGKGHWVGVENGQIKFNSLEYSNRVANGMPQTMRVLNFTGGVK
jgi:hypothetical protein